jgi:hypothetical protein
MTTHTTDIHLCAPRIRTPLLEQASDRRPCGHWDRPYLACFVRKFTKITGIFVRIIYNFTYFIISDKYFS